MEENNYLQNCSGTIYKVMDKYLLQLSPWEQNSDRRVFEYDLDDIMAGFKNRINSPAVKKEFEKRREDQRPVFIQQGCKMEVLGDRP